MDINWIKERIKTNEYFYSDHADQERMNDNLLITEIEMALNNGILIEKYSDTGRGKSGLVAGFTDTGKPVHIVCGGSAGRLCIITVYIPTAPKFRNPFERG